MAITLLPHTTYEWTDITMTAGEESGTPVVTCDAGYKFDGDITLHSNTSNTDYPATTQTETEVRFEQKYVDREWVVQGKVISAGGNVTNNVPNSTDNSQWNESGGYWDINVRTDDGYVFVGDIKAVYTNTSGYPKSVVLEQNGAKVWAFGELSYTNANTKITITGNTRSKNDLEVINNITGSGVTEKHTFDGETATFTVTGQYNPNKVRFFELKASYTNKAGTATKTPFVVQDLEYSQQATLTVTDIDPTKPVTLTGSYDEVVEISTNLSNCTANEDLPQYVKDGETVNVTLTANDGAEFDTEKSTPRFYYENASGVPQTQALTISSDKKKATGSIQVNNNWRGFAVIGSAYPVTVVGEQYGAINVYLVTLDELAEFSGKRFFKETGTDPSTGAAIYENIDLGAYVNKLRRVYTNIGASSTDVIRCGNYNTGVSCHQPAQDKITLDFGTAVVPAHNEDNTDYESEIQIFLPFAGFVNLNNAYAGKTIGLQYVINVVTGNGVALLSCDGVVFQVEETEPSSEIIHLSPSTQVKTVGGDDWNEMLYYGLEPYIYCKWYESASNGQNNDRQTGILGDFRGFNVFDDVTPIHTAEMLTEEQEMIYAALSDGVYIE